MPGHKTTASSFPSPIAALATPSRASQLAFLLMGQDKLRPRRSVFSVSGCRGCPQNFFQYPLPQDFTSHSLPFTHPPPSFRFPVVVFFFFLSGSLVSHMPRLHGSLIGKNRGSTQFPLLEVINAVLENEATNEHNACPVHNDLFFKNKFFSRQ